MRFRDERQHSSRGSTAFTSGRNSDRIGTRVNFSSTTRTLIIVLAKEVFGNHKVLPIIEDITAFLTYNLLRHSRTPLNDEERMYNPIPRRYFNFNKGVCKK